MAVAVAEAAPPQQQVRWWVPGDWNAFFGLFTNVILNVIVLSGLALGVVKLPDEIVFGRILPALGIALPLGNLYYTYLAYKLARAEGRDDVCAMPYGPSVPHMFIVVFVIMLPTALATQNPLLGWQAGLAWCFVIGLIVILGAFVGPTIRKYTPRAAMLGTLAGISLTFISMRPAFQSWEVPWIAFITLAVVMLSWMANVRMPGGLPGGLLAVIVGTVLAWITTMLGIGGLMKPTEVGLALQQFGVHLPIPGGEVFAGLANIAPLLVTAIPLGVYNFTEGMNNVESAAAAGDSYNLRSILLADGVGAVVGSVLGSPFPPAVYIGHPGWKSIGGRLGYSLATGVSIAVVCFLGLVALLLAVIPLVAILPILLYIGVVITAQAFQAVPTRHAPAVVLALIPNIAAWGKNLVDQTVQATVNATLVAAQVNVDGDSHLPLDSMAAAKIALGTPDSIIYRGMEVLGGGAILAGMIVGAVAAFIIDRNFQRAAVYALVGAVLSYIGFIHGEQLGLGQAWQVALGYLIMAGLLLYFSSREGPAPKWDDDPEN
jgi:AGZA family xanthine/uracil permease-like MFS transporter